MGALQLRYYAGCSPISGLIIATTSLSGSDLLLSYWTGVEVKRGVKHRDRLGSADKCGSSNNRRVNLEPCQLGTVPSRQ